EVPDNLETELAAAFQKAFPNPEMSKGLSKWAVQESMRLAGLPSPISKLGIAREYAELIAAADKLSGTRRIKELVAWIAKTLDLRPATPPSAILEDESV